MTQFLYMIWRMFFIMKSCVTVTQRFVLLQAFNVQTGDWLELPLESRYLTYNTVYRYYGYEDESWQIPVELIV